MPEPEGILAPYRVLDLTGELGPLCAKILADLGADVLKVEPPTGDPSRWRGPFPGDRPDPEQSLSWAAWNVNKRSVTLDLSLPAGRDGLRRRAREADFLIESFPPGELDGLGLGYPALAEENPRLIVTSITPFGQTGPYSKYRASDLELMAAAGCMSLSGEPDGPPLRVSLPQASAWAGVYAAAGSLLALHHRYLTGEGQHVDVAAQSCLLSALGHAPGFWDLNRTNAVRAGVFMTGRSITGARMRVMWTCRDGFLNFIIYGGEAGRRTNQALVRWMDESRMAARLLLAKDWSRLDIPPASESTTPRSPTRGTPARPRRLRVGACSAVTRDRRPPLPSPGSRSSSSPPTPPGRESPSTWRTTAPWPFAWSRAFAPMASALTTRRTVTTSRARTAPAASASGTTTSGASP